MAIARLTRRLLEGIEPQAKPYIIFDSDIKGLGLRVMPSGSCTFVLEYRPHGGGRSINKRRLSIGKLGTITLEQARKLALQRLAEVRLGSDPAANQKSQRAAVTVNSLARKFLDEHVQAKCKPATMEAHRAALKKLEAKFGSTKAEHVTRAALAALHSGMRSEPFAANRFLAVTSKMFNWAAQRGYVPEGFNPARAIERYKERGRERFLTAEELRRLGEVLRTAETVGLPYLVDETRPTAKHAPKSENRRRLIDQYAIAALRLLLFTGARLSEVLNLRWSEVDHERGLLLLPDSKTGAKVIVLNAPAAALLAGLPRIEGNQYVICGSKVGQPRADLKKPWSAIAASAELNGMRIHDLRHSFASVGAGAGLGLPLVGKLLGHSNPSTTARYAHLDNDPVRRASERIGATISAALEGREGAIIDMASPHRYRTG